MPTLETAPRFVRLVMGVTLTAFSLTSFAQDAKPPLPPPAEPLAPIDAVDAAKPATPAPPPMRETKPVIVDPTAPGAPGAPALPKNPGSANEPLFIPEIPGPGSTPQVPGPTADPGPMGPQKPPLERMYTVGKFIVKYGNDVQERNPKLPKESELSASEVMLLEMPDRRLYHVAKLPVATGSTKGSRGLAATTTAEQNEQSGKSDEDEALHPPMPVPSTPAAAPAAPSVKPAKKDAVKLAKEDKNTPKAIPKAGTTGKSAKFKVSDFGEPRPMSAMALLDVYDAIVKKLNDRGIIGVYVLADVNPRKGADDRDKAQGVVDIKVNVFISEVAKIRTIARKIPFKLALPKINDDDAPDGQPIKDPKHLWIKEKSPAFVSNPKKPGGPLEKPRLQNYLSRLNRYPGRRVDAAINAIGEPGKVMLDYLIKEQKNYIIYAQEANNGTPSTGEWRSRIGLELRQLANKDDILRLEYTTTDLQRFNSGILSYQFALVKPDVLKARVYGLYGQFSAEDVGFSGSTFTGDSLTAGLALTWTPLYWHGFPLDITAGGEFMRVTVNNEAAGGKSAVNFILPYLGVGTDRSTEKFSFSTNVQVKGSFADHDQDQLNGLGRFETDGAFWFMNADFYASIFLEPLLLGKKWGDLGPDGTKWKRGILANELALIVHSQYALGNRRLVPQLELIAGGASSVRGYPESFASGDTGFVGSIEYRLHIPRLFKPSSSAKSKTAAKNADQKPNGDKNEKTAKAAKSDKAGANAGKVAKVSGKAKAGGTAAAAAQQEPVTEVKNETAGGSPSFHLRPRGIGAGADWDLIARAFLDYGQTYNNRRQLAVETDRTMMSIGGGLELQMFKLPGRGAIPLYMTVRADYGYVLEAQRDLLLKPVEVGDNRIHISATIAW